MTREDLKNFKDAQDWVDEQLENYQARIDKITRLGQVMDGMPKAQNKPNYELEKIIDEYREILKIVHSEEKKLKQVIEQLNQLKPLHKRILTKRYVEGKKLEQVAYEVGYSYNKTCTYNGNALDEFDKYDEKSKWVKKGKIC